MRGNLWVLVDTEVEMGSIPAHAGEPSRALTGVPALRVYPRACGGTGSMASRKRVMWGLSPRMRGNHKDRWRTGEWHGSIPAHAGEPVHGGPETRMAGVYPRACGGTIPMGSLLPSAPGLSPRMRGNQSRSSGAGRRRGSIPAHAGEPAQETPLQFCSRVYPRACGGTNVGVYGNADAEGLSPRMRGNHLGFHGVGDPFGSIPAHAGEPHSDSWRSHAPRVYPRACGGTIPA